MAEALGEGVFKIRGDDSAMDRMIAAFDRNTQLIGRKLTTMENQASSSFKKSAMAAELFGVAVNRAWGYATMGISVLLNGIYSIGKASLMMAGDASEVGSKFDTVFGDQAGAARASLDAFGAAANRSKFELYEMASGLQDTFVPLGFARDTAAKMSDAVTKLAVDLASFNNASDVETQEALKSALIGNHETVRKFGVVITETTLNAKLMAMGIKGGTDAASEQQKAVARLAMIMESTSDAQGDAIKTQDSFANQMKGLWGVVKDLGTELGAALIPAGKEVIGFFREGVQYVKENATSIQEWGETLGQWTKTSIEWIKMFVQSIMNIDLTYQMVGIATAEFFTGIYDRGKWAFDNVWIAVSFFFNNFTEIAKTSASNFMQLWKNVFNNFSNIWSALWKIIKGGGKVAMQELHAELTKGFKMLDNQPEFKAFKGTDFSDQWKTNEQEWERRLNGMKNDTKDAGETIKKELDFNALMKEGGGKEVKLKIKAEITGAEEMFRKRLLERFDPEKGDAKKQTALQAKIADAGKKAADTLVKIEAKVGDLSGVTVTE